MFWNLLKKELREVLTVSSVISIVAMALIYAMIGKSVGSITEEVSKKLTVAVVNLDKGEFSKAIEDAVESYATVIYKGDNVDEAMEKLKKNNGSALLIVQEDFTEKLTSNQQAKVKVVSILKGLGIMDTVQSEVFKEFLGALEHQMVLTLLTKYGVENPNFVLDPIDREEATVYLSKVLEGMSPSQLLNYLSNRWLIVSIVVMMLIIMSGSTVISSLGLEKENKTLETLLTMPVARSHIILAKILAATIAGLVMAGIYMVGFSLYMRSFEIPASAGIDLGTSVVDYMFVALSMFSTLLCGISLAMLLGLISKDFKSAQTLTFPLVALAVFSMLLTMFKDLSTMPTALKIVVFAIPFTHAMTSVRNVLFDNYSLLIYGSLYNFALAAVLLTINVKIFNSDSLITGVKFVRRGLIRRFTSP
ncbi:ABC transporter [Pseudothermotoga hypogea DSM 11164 = NBRC 106472]|uniref:ABC transporter n=1 Tax=Pseudothermotoga hypogea DSM 11164 = NBRC 106472 TaxID=1123384 RepID=A0A0X1KS01_9THEM|nr:ABC transporter permease [Pseudothermotoga hypogea]AJC73970.1 ABC transporter [Pseudothermotoga hypogea DSM 11164 = NBRC 106472]